MTRREYHIERAASGSEMAVLAEAIDLAEQDDIVIYHRGLTGSAPYPIKQAAQVLAERGMCVLSQRITGDCNAHGDRIFEYLAIKSVGK